LFDDAGLPLRPTTEEYEPADRWRNRGEPEVRAYEEVIAAKQEGRIASLSVADSIAYLYGVGRPYPYPDSIRYVSSARP